MTTSLRLEIKDMMVGNLMLQAAMDEIGDDTPLFGPGSLGLDSVDALQMVVALDKKYGLKIQDPETARVVLQSISSIADAIEKHQQIRQSEAGLSTRRDQGALGFGRSTG